MMVQGEFDLNSVQRYTDSLRDILKQTMLDQELTFRNQVHELHRLYRTQRTLTFDLGWKEFETCDLWEESFQSSALPLTTHSSISMVGSSQLLTRNLSEGHRDFQLGAARFIGAVGKDLPKRGNAWNNSPQTMDLKRSLHGGDISDSEDLKLSLSIGGKKRIRGANEGKWLDKKTPPYSHYIIDLEQDSEPIPDEDANHVQTLGCSARLTRSRGENGSQISVISDHIISRSVKKDTSQSVTDGRECCQEQNSSSQGNELKQCPDGMLCNDLSNKKQACTLFKAELLDLNKVYLDDSSCHSNDPVMAYPSTASSSGVFSRLIGKSQEGSTVPLIQRTPNPPVVNSHMPQQDAGTAAKLDQLCEDLGSHIGDSKKKNLESTLEPSEGRVHVSLGARQLGCQKGKAKDTELSHSGGSQESCKSHFPPDSHGIKLGSCGLSVSDKLSGNHTGSQVAETLSVELDRRSSDSSQVKLKHESCMNKGESAEVDIFIQSAAESLIHISLESSACFQECWTKEGSNEVQKDLQPEYSCDSYEAMTLKLTESNVDEYSVSSKPFEVNESEMKDFGMKLRRGRRLKDFQKEILPGLASLARHEISEDINIMEGVLRSREYRRLRGKMADGESWSSPLSRRRSRGKPAGARKRR